MISVEKKICVCCGRCVDICPGNLLMMKNTCAAIRDVRDCWGCCACVKICPVKAIAYKLSADLGGGGTKVFAEDSKKKLRWEIRKGSGEKIFFEVDKKQANKF